MKKAIDCYARGKQKEVSADEYNRNYSYDRDRFICPACGENVFLTGNGKSNHFSHYKKSSTSIDCDRRVDGVSTESIYERVGLPMYIRKKSVKTVLRSFIAVAVVQQILIISTEILMMLTISDVNCRRSVLNVRL